MERGEEGRDAWCDDGCKSSWNVSALSWLYCKHSRVMSWPARSWFVVWTMNRTWCSLVVCLWAKLRSGSRRNRTQSVCCAIREKSRSNLMLCRPVVFCFYHKTHRKIHFLFCWFMYGLVLDVRGKMRWHVGVWKGGLSRLNLSWKASFCCSVDLFLTLLCSCAIKVCLVDYISDAFCVFLAEQHRRAMYCDVICSLYELHEKPPKMPILL